MKVPIRKRGVYLIPSAMSLGNLALGFYAILAGAHGRFPEAALAILIAHVLDMADGRVARWTGTTSDFGVEIDSLADLISFGLAPATLIYFFALHNYGKLGFLLALFFVICGALRLARFNVKAQEPEGTSGYFVGLPIPAAGGAIAIFILLYDMWSEGKTAKPFHLLMREMPVLYQAIPLIVFALALLMVSNIRYSSFKKVNLLKPRTIRALVLLVFSLFMIYAYPQNSIFILYAVYILWGVGEYIWRAYGLRRGDDGQKPIQFETILPKPAAHIDNRKTNATPEGD